MTTASLGRIARHDHRITAMSLVALTALAWLYLAVVMANDMNAAPWSALEFSLMFVMWAVMMVGMMTPSAGPMILMFARLTGESAPSGSTGLFVAGYLAVWSAFSLVATTLQWSLHEIGLLSPMMASANAVFGGLVCVAAGLYQWTLLKQSCLRHCQTPLSFLMTRWREGAGGAFRMGLAHGAFCVGCCWALMALLFVGGVMNLLWVAALAGFVLVEKISLPGPWLPRLTGAALIAWGGSQLVTTLLP
jgi:predicted metal-binding membrane protein